MTIRRLAVLSGIDTRVIDRVAPILRSMAIQVAFVRMGADGNSRDYYDRLTRRTLQVAAQLLVKPDVKIHALLVSSELSEDEWACEAAYFFPALRRFEIARSFRRDTNRGQEMARAIHGAFTSISYLELVRKASPQGESRLLLPITNTKLPRLRRHFLEIYRLNETALSRRLERDISRRKGMKGYRVQGLDFRGAVNDGTHPIRRCTDSPECDLAALFRFGVVVPERFEFDVSCETGLEGKTFHLCNDEAVRIPKGTSHLNMRMNDDFLAA